MNSVEERLRAVGRSIETERRPFDVSAGLHRLARDAGYTPVSPSAPRAPAPRRTRDANVLPGPRAAQQLAVIARWVINAPQAAGQVRRLAEEIGEEDTVALHEVALADLDVDGAHVFACMLYLAGHTESACFWWQFAAGAGNRNATYCLYLQHLEQGDVKEAEQWRAQFQHGADGPDDAFLHMVEQFTGYVWRHCTATPAPRLTDEVARLASHEPDDVPVLPERELADRLQHSANQP